MSGATPVAATTDHERIAITFDNLKAAIARAEQNMHDDASARVARSEVGITIHAARDALLRAAVADGIWATAPDPVGQSFAELSESARGALAWLKTLLAEGSHDAALSEARRLRAVGEALVAALDPACRPIFSDLPRLQVADQKYAKVIEGLAETEHSVRFLREHIAVLGPTAREQHFTTATYRLGVARTQAKKIPS
ncbi:hypothetical protein IP84_00735 [beta proteobacterium AAP99]|nr:hypothetical protein IP84_00735 [beta proteobacterium AAP99]